MIYNGNKVCVVCVYGGGGGGGGGERERFTHDTHVPYRHTA